MCGQKTKSLRQVQRGLAWHYKAYQREQPPDDRLAYAAAEKDAAAARIGLWQDAKPVTSTVVSIKWH